ncbi:uncharacterized protein At5g39865-like [Bidens hawaiensis]|uniref:uncharacterized protein At5g39865-like n=1 Tax=Bidens hawaiensis TaxID=980011 RepID=UPI0040490AC1
MWPYRRNNSNNNNNNNDNEEFLTPKSRRAPSSPNFKRRSFKDIETLTHDGNNMINDDASSSGDADTKRPTTVFHRVSLANQFTRIFSARPKPNEPPDIPPESTKPTPLPEKPKPTKSERLEKFGPRVTIPGSEKRVVVYMTSLRAVRSTFEACRTVRSILHGFRVPIDERDLLMDSSFFDEIRKIMAQIGQGKRDDKRVALPRVFIRGRYIGGADEIVELHEIGELKKLMSGLPAAPAGVCDECGGFRFILCEECNGSHKLPLDDGGFSTCTSCNENGLIRCPSCLTC